MLKGLLIAGALMMFGGGTAWINSAKRSSCTNPFFSKGFTVTLDGKRYEIGFRDDGVMVWREPEVKK